MKCLSVILAAGLGTRMRSSVPKVLHPLGGRPLIAWALAANREATGYSPIIVIGPEHEGVREAVGDRAEFVVQRERLGTAHALLQCAQGLGNRSDLVLVSYGDMPLIQAETLATLIDTQRSNSGPVTLLTVEAEEPRGFGRILRDNEGRMEGIIEAAHATPEQLVIRELNVGTYCFDSKWLWECLPKVSPSPKGEYYLTDLVGLAVSQGKRVEHVEVPDRDEVVGINTREHLAQAERILRRWVNRRWMLAGITIIDPETTYIGADVELGMDTVLHPNTHLGGETKIGRDCQIGPSTMIYDSRIGDQCRVLYSVVERAELEDEVDVGPFAHLRQGAYLSRGVHMGNFGEIKNSVLGPEVKMGHFSYVGDATIGKGVNIGAGTITCNYDGQRKHPTVIEEGAFIGSDTMLVAPVRIGRGAHTGAGSVVTHDVPENSVAVGIPARVIRKITKGD